MYMHHANNLIKVPMGQALDEMVAWANANGTNAEELVHLGVTDIAGSDLPKANQMVIELLVARNIRCVPTRPRIPAVLLK